MYMRNTILSTLHVRQSANASGAVSADASADVSTDASADASGATSPAKTPARATFSFLTTSNGRMRQRMRRPTGHTAL